MSTSEAHLDKELLTQQEMEINELAQAFQVVPLSLDGYITDVCPVLILPAALSSHGFHQASDTGFEIG